MIRRYKGPYGKYSISISMKRYQNGHHRMEFIDSEDGFPVLVASVAIEESLSPDEIAIKNYSENEGVLGFLIEEGIVSNPLKYINIGFVKIPICKINETFLEEYKYIK
jgi:hypothetical protein